MRAFALAAEKIKRLATGSQTAFVRQARLPSRTKNGASQFDVGLIGNFAESSAETRYLG